MDDYHPAFGEFTWVRVHTNSERERYNGTWISWLPKLAHTIKKHTQTKRCIQFLRAHFYSFVATISLPQLVIWFESLRCSLLLFLLFSVNLSLVLFIIYVCYIPFFTFTEIFFANERSIYFNHSRRVVPFNKFSPAFRKCYRNQKTEKKNKAKNIPTRKISSGRSIYWRFNKLKSNFYEHYRNKTRTIEHYKRYFKPL